MKKIATSGIGYIQSSFHRNINERVIIYSSLVGLFLYILLYGNYVTGGVSSIQLEYKLAIMLIPLFLIDILKMVVETYFKKEFHSGTEELNKITVIIPSYNGGKFIGATIKDLLKKFSPKQIIVSSNGSTDDTCDVAKSYGVQVIKTDMPIGKVGAINVALDQVETEYCLILDDDVLIGEAVFPTNPLGSVYSGIAFRVLPIITNWVSKIQAHEYRKSMDIGKVFHNSKATVQNISGAIGLFNIKELKRQVAIHTGEFCGEDLQRTLLVHLYENNKGVVIVDSLVETEVPQTLWSLFKQRTCGWNPGLYSNLGNYLKILFKKNTPWTLRYDSFYNAFLVILTDPLRLITLPILIFYPVITITFYVIYVFLETIPYLVLKRREPYWVILVQPFYGVFSFITRVVAFAIFVYRRLTVYCSKAGHIDGYRHAHLKHRFLGVVASQIIVFILCFSTLAIMRPAFANTILDQAYLVALSIQKY